MNKIILLTFLVSISQSTLANNNKDYSDNMASYAAIMGFSPIKGNVRDSYQSEKTNNSPYISKGYVISFEPNGCINSIKIRNKNNINLDLYKSGNKLVSFNDIKGIIKEDFYLLDSNCNIIKDIKQNKNFYYNGNLVKESSINNKKIEEFEFNNKNKLISIKKYNKPPSNMDISQESNEEEINCIDFDDRKNPLNCHSVNKIENKKTEIKFSYHNIYY